MFIPQKSLENFGLTSNQAETFSFMTRFLRKTGCITFHHVKIVLVLTGVIVIIAVWGISRIRINDNPIKWFARSHPIRIADQVLNEHFGGTYMAYLVLEPQAAGKDLESYRRDLVLRLSERSSELKGAYPLAPQIFTEIIDLLKEKEEKVATPEGILNNLIHLAEDRLNRSRGDAAYIWEETSLFWRG